MWQCNGRVLPPTLTVNVPVYKAKGTGVVSLQKFVFPRFSISDSPEYGEPGTFTELKKLSVA